MLPIIDQWLRQACSRNHKAQCFPRPVVATTEMWAASADNSPHPARIPNQGYQSDKIFCESGQFQMILEVVGYLDSTIRRKCNLQVHMNHPVRDHTNDSELRMQDITRGVYRYPPMLQMSTLGLYVFEPSNISGGRYQRVTTSRVSSLLGMNARAKPKSAILMT